MNIETAILLLTTLAGAAKAYFEWRKAKEEAARADNNEKLLVSTIEGVEDAKKDLPVEIRKEVARKIAKRTKDCGVAAELDDIVQEVTKGLGDVKRVTRKYKKVN
jgi:hypothetical protein